MDDQLEYHDMYLETLSDMEKSTKIIRDKSVDGKKLLGMIIS